MPNSIRVDFLRISCSMSVMVCVAMTSGCTSKRSDEPFDLSDARYVGREACVECHQQQTESHAGSHHDLAMQLATDETVLADFDDVQFTHHGIESRMYRDGERFMIATEGPDGAIHDYHVKYVFGLEPLQQYMVEFPSSEQAAEQTAEGSEALPRVQVLRLSWDTQAGEWFYLPPPDVDEKLDPNDDLHWTGIAQRWNTMCAECHSTDYRKGFEPSEWAAGALEHEPNSVDGKFSDPKTPPIGQYHSTFSEIDVSCEACHGPGSLHVELASHWFPGWNRQRGYGLANLKASPEHQIQACAPCHSRRSVVAGGFQAGEDYYDYYTNTLLDEGVYYADGQILDEDYVHGSFIQSKMYHKGIQCTDCHDPHTARLKHDGNQVCTSCHQHPAAKYDTVGHHFHEPGSEAARCVNCHMPSTTYMEVDPRRDHSLRIPRPDLSLEIQSPNACTGCHLEVENLPAKDREGLELYQDWLQAARQGNQAVADELRRVDRWCDQACDQWYGEERYQEPHFGQAIAAGRRGDSDAAERLARLLRRKGYEAPAIARATALQLLRELDPERAATEAARLVDDEHPLVRSSVCSALLGSRDLNKSVRLLESLLKDPKRSVRIEAARNLLELPANRRSSDSSHAMRNATDELLQSLEHNNDRSGAHLTLGVLAEQRGRTTQAINHYQAAIRVEPYVTGPRTNLAALLERNLSRQSSSSQSDAGSGDHPLRSEIDQLRAEELELLLRDYRLFPENAGIRYRVGLALYLQDRLDEAADHLVAAAELAPSNAEFAQAAAMLFESMRAWDDALEWAEKAVQRSSRSQQSLLLQERIQQEATRNPNDR